MTKKCYVLDECIIRHASNLQDKHNNFSASAIKVIFDIIYNCDKIIINNILKKKYDEHMIKLKKSHSTGIGLVHNLFREILYNQLKLEFNNEDIGPIKNEDKLPDDDIYLVKLAMASGAILVTSDDKLIEKLAPDVNGYVKDYNITVAHPDAINKGRISSISRIKKSHDGNKEKTRKKTSSKT